MQYIMEPKYNDILRYTDQNDMSENLENYVMHNYSVNIILCSAY